MIFIWGQKPVLRDIGYVADFCHVCHAVRAFSVQEVGMVWHVYYLPVSKAETAGHQRCCCECGMAYPMELTQYPRVSPQLLPLEALRDATNPHLAVRLAHAPPEADRQRRIDSALRLQADSVEAYDASTHLDREVWWSIVASAAFCSLIYAGLLQRAPQNLDTGFIIAFFLSLGFVAWQLSRTSKRFLRREVLPRLARALAPLQPSESELAPALERLRGNGRKLGALVTVPQLLQAIAALRR
jgi:hypothetical protein